MACPQCKFVMSEMRLLFGVGRSEPLGHFTVSLLHVKGLRCQASLIPVKLLCDGPRAKAAIPASLLLVFKPWDRLVSGKQREGFRRLSI